MSKINSTVTNTSEYLQYLPSTKFSEADGYYEVEIDNAGLTVYSECCAERMSEPTAHLVYEALGRWLADVDKMKKERGSAQANT